MTHAHLSNSHLPHLSVERIEQMAAFACSHAQDKVITPRFSSTAFLRQFTDFMTMRKPVFAGAGLVMASVACVALMVLAPTVPHPVQPSAPSSAQATLTAQKTAPSDINHSENTISEYIIQDFLDEMV